MKTGNFTQTYNNKQLPLIYSAFLFIGLSACSIQSDFDFLNKSTGNTPNVQPIGSETQVETGVNGAPLDELFQNKTLPTGEPIKEIIVITLPQNGTLTINGLQITYTPAPDFVGEDQFTYQALGEKGGQTTGNIKVNVKKPYTWTGLGNNRLWSNPSNWFKGVPGSGDVAYFDNSCIQCKVEINESIQISGLETTSNFTGEIEVKESLISPSVVTIGNQGIKLNKGKIILKNNRLEVNGPYLQDQGQLESTTGHIVTNNTVTLSENSILSLGTSLWEISGTTSSTLDFKNSSLHHLSFTHSGVTKTITGTLVINGNLSINAPSSSLNTGTLDVMKNITVQNLDGGTALVRAIGTSDQTITGELAGGLPHFEIASQGGIVSILGTLSVSRNFTYTSGSVNFNDSTLRFYSNIGSTTIKIPETLALHNVIFNHNSNNKILDGTLSVFGQITYDVTSASVTGGIVHAYKDIVLTKSSSSNGTHLLRVIGTNDQTISGTSVGIIPNIEIAKTGGTLTLADQFTVSKNFTYTSGNVDFTNGTVTFTGANTGGTITIPDPSPLSIGHVRFTHDSTGKTISGRLVVLNSLYFNVAHVSLTGGIIELQGDMTLERMQKVGSTVIELKGNKNQTLNGTSVTESGNIPALLIDKSGGTATFLGDIGIVRNFTYTAGQTEFNSGLGRSTLRFTGANTGGTLTPGSLLLGNVKFVHDSTGKTLTGTLRVAGDLTINTPHVWMGGSGIIEVEGNITMSRTGGSSASLTSAAIHLVGSQNQTITHVTTYTFPGKTLTINKPGGNVTLLSNLHLTATQNLTVTNAQEIRLQGFNLNGNGTFTCHQGSVAKAGGTLWSSGTTSNLGCNLDL